MNARGRLLRGAGLAAAAALAAAIVGSSRFHGQVASRSMELHYAAHAQSAHARVACPACHAQDTPDAGARPSGRVCLDCHPPGKAAEDRLRVVERFAPDENNTATRSVLLIRMRARRGRRGIHDAHLRPGVTIVYTASGAGREVVSRVEVRDVAHGRAEVYAAKPVNALRDARPYIMDCTDCHNRTAHRFEPPSHALDRLMSEETLSPSLRFIKREGMELLRARFSGLADARAGIRSSLVRFYRERDPATYERRRAEIGGAADVLAAIYQPDWARYPDNLGHTGCLRCHDGRHRAAGGAAITDDCGACHELVAVDEPTSPAEREGD